VRQLVEKILETGVTHESDLVTGFLAPDRDYLGHDAGEVRMHEPGVQPAGGTFGNEIDDGDLQFAHGSPSCCYERG
jgi:hypothetical protein